ncbi:hypothetical protein CEXT_531211 [Caerostris extrusa]|uniref:Cytochrome P450 n=1 Tax=Caerostris extrusa TaxID=172846 RepID=A0AAV4P4U8_CAEEX|nr:hypothetical protein CEXT_531211 [Caerostris extrusa]
MKARTIALVNKGQSVLYLEDKFCWILLFCCALAHNRGEGAEYKNGEFSRLFDDAKVTPFWAGYKRCPGARLKWEIQPRVAMSLSLGVPEWRFHKKKLRRAICLTCFSVEFAVV